MMKKKNILLMMIITVPVLLFIYRNGYYELKDGVLYLLGIKLGELLLISAFGLSLYTLYKNNKMANKALSKDVLLSCLDKYYKVMDFKAKAIESLAILDEKTKKIDDQIQNKIRKYHRYLFDLHWTEYNLYRKGLLDKDTYVIWLFRRSKDCQDGDSQFSKYAIPKNYEEHWLDLLEEQYFDMEDPFVHHMNIVHTCETIEDIRDRAFDEDEIQKRKNETIQKRKSNPGNNQKREDRIKEIKRNLKKIEQ